MATSEESKAPEQPELQRANPLALPTDHTQHRHGERILAAVVVLLALLLAGAFLFAWARSHPSSIKPGEYANRLDPKLRAKGLAVLPNGRECLIGFDRCVVRWNAGFMRWIIPEPTHYREFAASPDGKYIAVAVNERYATQDLLPPGDEGDILEIWSVAERKRLHLMFTTPWNGWTVKLLFSPDSKTLLSVFGWQSGHMDFGDPHAVLWDVETGKKREELGWVLGNTGNEKGFYVRDAAFSPDGRWLALSIVHSPNGDHNFRRTYVNTHLAYRRLTLWKVGTALAEDYPVSYFAPDDTIHIGEDIRCLTFSHDGRRVLGSCLHHSLPRLKLLVVDVATKQRVNAELPYRLFPARHLAVSPVDSVVALGCEQGIALFDDQELRLIHLFERPVQDGRRGYYSDPRTAFTPDGNKLVVLEFSGTVTVYDVAPYLVEVRQRQAKTSKKMEEGAAP